MHGPSGRARRSTRGAGFTVMEVVVAATVVLVAIIVTASIFPMGHQRAVDAARTTSAVAAARQILEDLGALPFDSVRALDGFDTGNFGTVPPRDPELSAARRWRYMIAGAGAGFRYTAAELAQYGPVTPLGGAAKVRVSSPPKGACSAAGSRCQATVTVSVPGLPESVQLTTIIVRMF